MTEIQTLLVIAYVLMTALLLLAVVYGRIHYLVKFLLVILVIPLYFYSYQGWKQVQGWPSRTTLPDHFLLHASVIHEPNLEQGTPGQIFIWASALQGSFPASEPRAYVIPYGQEVHSALEDALRNMRNGNVQLGAKINKDLEFNKTSALNGIGEENFKLEFSPLPDPALPEK